MSKFCSIQFPKNRFISFHIFFRMKKPAEDPEEMAIKYGHSVKSLWEWYTKGTRLIVVATAGMMSTLEIKNKNTYW